MLYVIHEFDYTKQQGLTTQGPTTHGLTTHGLTTQGLTTQGLTTHGLSGASTITQNTQLRMFFSQSNFV